jgi:hypothetical protein
MTATHLNHNAREHQSHIHEKRGIRKVKAFSNLECGACTSSGTTPAEYGLFCHYLVRTLPHTSLVSLIKSLPLKTSRTACLATSAQVLRAAASWPSQVAPRLAPFLPHTNHTRATPVAQEMIMLLLDQAALFLSLRKSTPPILLRLQVPHIRADHALEPAQMPFLHLSALEL